MTNLRNKNIWPTKCSATKKPQCCLHFGQELWKISNVIWNPSAKMTKCALCAWKPKTHKNTVWNAPNWNIYETSPTIKSNITTYSQKVNRSKRRSLISSSAYLRPGKAWSKRVYQGPKHWTQYCTPSMIMGNIYREMSK